MRIACLHTVESNIPVFEAALKDVRSSDVALVHQVRADLLAMAERAAGLTEEMSRLTAEALRALARDADAVLLTCSTVGPAVNAVHGTVPAPVLRVDEALARKAVSSGGEVIVLCTAESTLTPTRELFEAAARGTCANIDVRLVRGAWAAFKDGDQGRYLELIAKAADDAFAEGAARVALAQASMSGAAKLSKAGDPVLTSPAAGVAAAIAAVKARNAGGTEALGRPA